MKRNLGTVLTIFGLLSLGLGSVLWLWAGWRIGPQEAPAALLSEFPGAALGALLAVGLCGALMVLAGSMLTPLLAARGREALPWAAFSFLAAGSIMGLFGGFVAFFFVAPGVLLVLPGLALVAMARGWRPAAPRSMEWGWEHLLAGGLMVALVAAAMAPAVESDGLRYHLPVVGAWLREGRFVSLPYNANSNLPAMQSLLVALSTGPFEIGRSYQLFHALHTAALAIVCGELGRIVARDFVARGRDGARHLPRVAGGLCTLMALAIPAVAILGTWPFADVAALAYFMAGIWVAMPGVVVRAEARAALASLFLGAALATKLSLLPLVAMVGVFLLARAVLRPRAGRCVALLLIPGALVLGPWLLKSFLFHGNPVYPLAYGVFGGPEWSEFNDAFYKAKSAEKGFGRTVEDLVRTPFDTTVNWPVFEGFNPGPWPLALLPMAVVAGLLPGRRWGRGVRWPLLVLLLAGWVVWFHTYQSVRFLLPEIVLLIVLAVPLLSYAGGAVTRWALLACAVAGGLWAPVYHLRVSHVYRQAFGIVGEDLAISRKFNAYPAVMWLNANSEPREPVLYIGEFRPHYARVYTPVSSDWFDTPLVLAQIRQTADNGELYALWRAQGIRRVLLNQAELALFERDYFRTRFDAEEWARFEEVRRDLLARVEEQPVPGVFIAQVPPE